MNSPEIEQEELIIDGPTDDAHTKRKFAILWIRQHKNQFIWNTDQKRWLYFSNGVWKSDSSGIERAKRSFSDYIDIMVMDMSAQNQPLEASEIKAVCNNSSIKGCLELAQAYSNAVQTDFDNSNLIALSDGQCLNTDTYEVRKALPSDMLSRTLGCAYDKDNNPTKFIKVLNETLAGHADKEEVVALFQMEIGLALTGQRHEENIHYFQGEGGRGKSTITEPIIEMFGGYQDDIDTESLQAGNNQHEAWKADGAGARLVYVSEVDDKKLNGAFLKKFVTAHPVKTSYKGGPRFSYRPQALIIMEGNPLPCFSSGTDGMFRRLRFFHCRKPPAVIDTSLRHTIKSTELPGILNWAIDGLKKYRARNTTDKLQIPASMLEGIKDVKLKSQRQIDRFIQEALTVDSKRKDWILKPNDMYSIYTKWFEENADTDRFGNINKKNMIQSSLSLGKHLRETPIAELREHTRDGNIYQGVKEKTMPL